MHLELVTQNNIENLRLIMSDPDAITYLRAPQSYGAENTYFLILKDDLPTVVGYCDLHSIDMIGRTAWTTMFIQSDKREGLGEAHGVYKELAEWAFMKMNLRKILAETFDVRVANALEKIKWDKEGTLKDIVYHDGEYKDLIIYSLRRK